jgi:hypothetical protein
MPDPLKEIQQLIYLGKLPEAIQQAQRFVPHPLFCLVAACVFKGGSNRRKLPASRLQIHISWMVSLHQNFFSGARISRSIPAAILILLLKLRVHFLLDSLHRRHLIRLASLLRRIVFLERRLPSQSIGDCWPLKQWRRREICWQKPPTYFVKPECPTNRSALSSRSANFT